MSGMKNNDLKASRLFRSMLSAFARLFAVVVILLLGGCATPEMRISSNPAMFASLPPEHQVLVRQGRVAEGMSMDAVYLAWGSPDHYRESLEDGRQRVTWLYLGYQTEVLPRYTWSSFYDPDCPYGYRYPVYDPVYVNVPYLYRMATFEGGRLVAYEAPLAQGSRPVRGILAR